MSIEDLEKIKEVIPDQSPPYQSPVVPVELDLDSEIQFHCHKNISCFNACCKNIDITLTPYDIVRLKRRLNMTSSQWVNQFTVPFPMDAHEMPGLKLITKPGSSACVFLTEQGCSVYEDRPVACRYYALGSMGVRKQGDSKVEDIYFVVKEDHCKGHDEPRKLTVREYLEEQGIFEYDENNRHWRDIVLKKRSSGPTIGKPTSRSLQLFDMCSYDIDNFRAFFNSEGFDQVFDLSEQEKKSLSDDENKLFQFSCRFLKQVLFGELSIPVKSDAREKRLAEREKHAKAGDRMNPRTVID